ncbi:MAG: tetratricopeptide repeat protein [Phycisphaerales bacterium]|nr:tetratricopeptide repeat protein [Phycisphaerales bacterium]
MSDWQSAEEHVERATTLLHRGRWMEAEHALRKAVEIDPSRGEWHAMLASALDALGRLQESLASIRQASALLPDDPEPLLAAADLCGRLKRWEETLEHADRALELSPNDDLVHAFRISALNALGRVEDAEVAYFLAQQSLEEMPRCLVAMGDLQLGRQRYDQAHWCYHEAMRQDPTIPRLRARLASLLAATGKPQRALQLQLADLRENPASIDTLLECGTLLARMRRLPEAIEKFHRVLEFEPANIDAHWYLGQASLELGQYDKARVEFEVVRRLDPDTPLVRRRLAEALLGCERLDDARDQLVEAFDRVAEDEEPEELDRLGELLLRVDLNTEARTLYERIVLNGTETPETLCRLAVCRFRCGDRTEGIAMSRRVLRINPECLRSMHNLALAALEEGRLLSAARWVERGLRIDPCDDELRRVRSRVWTRMAVRWTLGLPAAARKLGVRILDAIRARFSKEPPTTPPAA